MILLVHTLKRIAIAACLSTNLVYAQSISPDFNADSMSQRIEQAALWLNNAMSTTGRTPGVFAQILPMDIANYKNFVQLAYSESVDPELGEPALSAFFQAQARMDSQVKDICFLLYNPKAKSILESQFISPHMKKFGQSMTPYLFIAAHEVGHCMEFQRYSGESKLARNRSKLQMEVGADAFALLLLRKAGVNPEELTSIIDSRQNQSTTHATWRWIQPALTLPLPIPSNRLIEDLWQMADKISEQAR